MKVLKKSQKISKRIPRMVRDQATSKSGRFVYKFGTFCLDHAERILLDGGENVSLTPKVFDTLVVLVQNAGRLVTKESLLAEVWPDTFVEEANLSVNIATLRKALGEIAGEHQYIQTISKRGYRFVADVTRERTSMEATERGVTVGLDKKRPEKKTDPEVNSLAVLPFDNGSDDPNAEYLSDGLTESIINSLSHLQNFRVMARNTVFRYKPKEVDPQVIGQELGVDSVLTGRILQLGDRIIVRAEMVSVETGWHMWGEQYHRKLSDILKVQQEISEEISTTLKRKLTREEKRRVTTCYTENVDAYRAYLRGRYHWNKFDRTALKKAVDYFFQAIEIDPAYALAYAGLADSYYRLSNVYAPTRDAMSKAKAAAIKALDIDETLSEAHAALGLIKLFYDWDWLGAEEEFNRAIESNPNNAIAHQRLGLYFNLLGRFAEARRELELALTIDPLSPQIYWGFALTFLLARDYQRAIEELQKTLEMDGNYKPALYLLGRVYEEAGQVSQAIAEFKRILALSDAPMFLAALGHAYALSGKHREARKVLKDLQEQSKQQYVSAYSKAVIHLTLGNKSQGFACLEQAYEDRCEMMTWLKIDPAFDSVRADIRFSNLMRRVGLNNDQLVCQKYAAS